MRAIWFNPEGRERDDLELRRAACADREVVESSTGALAARLPLLAASVSVRADK
jgi:hypothetical protein